MPIQLIIERLALLPATTGIQTNINIYNECYDFYLINSLIEKALTSYQLNSIHE